ncbi:hypothetical protein ACTXJX_14880 [Glutamicibacter ardleyensis]|uniref:hypothetical protein n=1 Tax=Glutamicibacter ardleyensis TaxID=225894 RepID=UPI003FD246BA
MNITDTLSGSVATDALGGSLVIGANATDLYGGWAKVWGAITAGWPTIATTLTVVGVLLGIAVFIGAIISARRGAGQVGPAMKKQAPLLIIAAVLAGPQLIFPITLKIFDIVINVGFMLYKTIFGVS